VKISLNAIGLLSLGDMEHVVAQVLQAHGLRLLTCLKGRSQRTRMLAQKAGIADVPTYEELGRHTEMILSILVPEEALNSARQVAQAVRHAGQTTVSIYRLFRVCSPAVTEA
jgi:3-hydroxyisobutyrate dehydrogenase-like beta-hydroxyacid dehydrogenase